MLNEMKKIILTTALCLGLYACAGRGTQGEARPEEAPQKDLVEVLCFHSRQRCATCRAIERNAREAIEARFADELAQGSVVFRTIDISEAQNAKIAEAYKVGWSSLVVCRWKAGEETREDMTAYAFANARTAPEKFRAAVAAKVESLME